MNRINPELDSFNILSTSDAHSLENFWREASVFEVKEGNKIKDICYWDLERAIKERKVNKSREKVSSLEKNHLSELFESESKLKLTWTIEFFPQEGKYFGDWHSKCDFLTEPADTVKRNWVCPICGWKITVWVFHRCYNLWKKERLDFTDFGSKYFFDKQKIQKFAKFFDREEFYYIVPLWNLIKEVWNVNRGTKKSMMIYNELIKVLWSEFYILIDLELEKAYEYNKDFWEALQKVREGDLNIKSWFDWNFGIVSIYSQEEKEKKIDSYYRQNPLF